MPSWAKVSSPTVATCGSAASRVRSWSAAPRAAAGSRRPAPAGLIRTRSVGVGREAGLLDHPVGPAGLAGALLGGGEEAGPGGTARDEHHRHEDEPADHRLQPVPGAPAGQPQHEPTGRNGLGRG